jgi:protein-disulfide isomerase
MKLYLTGKAFVMLMPMVGVCCTSFAQQKAQNLQYDIESLMQGQAAIREELRTIKTMLLKMQIPQNSNPSVSVRGIEFELGNRPVLGSNAAKVVMIEFTDYQCPFCSRYVQATFPEIRKGYIDTGKLRYVVMDFPLSMHKLAPKAAEACHCAMDQGKYWEMHGQLMSDQESLERISIIASTLNLDVNQFEGCLAKGKYEEDVNRGKNLANKLGISGVPGFVLAESNPDNPSRVKGISFIAGAQPFEYFRKEIDQALAIGVNQNDSLKGQRQTLLSKY